MSQMHKKSTFFTPLRLIRIIGKTAVLFFLCNIVFALTTPQEQLGQLTLYNWLLTGRERLPYGEQTADSYNLSLNNLPAMFASHMIHQQKKADEFRIILLGDSATWGWLLDNPDTLAGQLNQLVRPRADGRIPTVYNLGYPIMSLSKDLLILDEAKRHQPDMIIWLVSLESMALEQQTVHPVVQNNTHRLEPLVTAYNLPLELKTAELTAPTFWEQTIVGQRRPLADLIRLQSYGFAWSSTGIDQTIPHEITLRQSDLAADTRWQQFSTPQDLTINDLAFEILAAGINHAAETEVIIINEPIYRSDGANSDIRYNSFYPRWAYDQYRELLTSHAAERGWRYIDLWDAIPADQFTDTPLHLTPNGTKQLAIEINQQIFE